MKLKFKIKGKEYEVEILEEGEDRLKIKVGGKEFSFGKEEKEKIAVAKTTFPKRNFSKKEIRALVAGIVSKIFVKEGEFIKKDQKVLILSAMKLENEIISESDGRIKEIKVKENQSVNTDDILLILE